MAIKEISLRHDLHALSLFWQYAVRRNWARENIIRNVDIPSGKDSVRMNVLSPGQEALYFETCLWMDRAAQFIASPDRTGYRDLYDFMRLMIQQGTRPEELLELRKNDVDLVSVKVFIQSGKTEAARRLLRLTTESSEILKRRMSEPGPFVFPSPKNPAAHRGPTWRTYENVLEAMAGRADACVFVSYDLRHTAATRWATDGMAVPVLMATLGHANLRSVMKYIHITADNIEHEMDRIEKMRLSRTNDASPPPSSSGPCGTERLSQTEEPDCTSSAVDPYCDSAGNAGDRRHRAPNAKCARDEMRDSRSISEAGRTSGMSFADVRSSAMDRASRILIVSNWPSTNFPGARSVLACPCPRSHHLAAHSLPEFCREGVGKQANRR